MAKKEASLDIRYIRLDDPMGIRKNLLEAAVDATTLLKRWESYKMIKEKKLIYARKLRLIMKKIHNEEVEFKKHFPIIHEETQSGHRIIKTEVYNAKKRVVREIEGPRRSELDKEIDQIKAKLETLNSKIV